MSLIVQAFQATRQGILAVVVFVVALSLASVSAPQRQTTANSNDRPIQLHWDLDGSDYDQTGSMYNVARQVGAPTFWRSGYNGAGVDVALIDSGVAPVDGLNRNDKIIYGPDVSFEGDVATLHNLDTFGHGTHMAGIIAGKGDNFRGIAPGARIVSLKAADGLGRSSVGQVIAAIKWVVQHRSDGDLNIRVLNLSFGTTPLRSYQADDLAYAVEQAWNAGIAVVVSAGNSGTESAGLSSPAFDPYVIAVGADNTHGTTDVSDDSIPSFSSRGDGQRNPDVVAPGKSIVSLRVPGSYLDMAHPEAKVGEQLFRGSGTSQAAAVVSGAAALIISARPSITPDRLKQLLKSTAESVPDASAEAQGDGLVDLGSALWAWIPRATQDWLRSTGGEINAWATADASGNSWSLADPNGNSWSANVWTGAVDAPDDNSWSADGWQGVSWGKPANPKGRQADHPGASPDENGQAGHAYGVSWGKSRRGGLGVGRGKGHSDGDTRGISWGKPHGNGVSVARGNPHKDRDTLGVSWGKPRGSGVSVARGNPHNERDTFGVSWGRRGIGVARGNPHTDRETFGVSWGKRMFLGGKAKCI